MRRAVVTLSALGALAVLVIASQGFAGTQKSGAFSGFRGRVSCHWTRTGSSTTVRCWGLQRPGSNSALTSGDTTGRLANTQWHPPVGPAMIFNHKYSLGNGVTCSYRYHRPTDTTIIKAVQCATAQGAHIFAYPTGVAAD